jgi:tetratricopeptide (TPR) repeat protein
VLGAGLWLLHPLWTSTTLYVVQREAMLAGTFVLLGLLAYLHGRRRISVRPPSGVFWIAGAVGLCTLLALLSKANGILLPLFVAVVELTFIRSQPKFANPSRSLSRSLRVAIYPVVLATFAYLIYIGFRGFFSSVPSVRPWTLVQRLLTEPRVLLDYLSLLVAPRPYSRGLFNDSYAFSQDLLHPWTTLPSLLIIVGLLIATIVGRKRHPALALAIAFYFAGQVMESTTIPLELYFEHRNYVPAMLLFWPLALWLTGDGALARIKPALTVGALLLLATETWSAAKLWGEPNVQALVWAAQNPESPRAQSYAASAERSMGHYAQAENRLRKALETHPDQIQLAINLLGVRCHLGSVASTDIAAAEYALREGSNRGPLSFDWILQAINLVHDHACSGLTTATLQELIDVSRENQQAKDSPTSKQALLILEGQLALSSGDNAGAESKFLAALEAAPKVEVALKQAAIMGSHNLPEIGLKLLDYYRQLVPDEKPPAIASMAGLHQWLLYRNGYWDNEIAHLRKVLEEDVTSASKPPLTKQADSAGKTIP